jgi:hypothetical protein
MTREEKIIKICEIHDEIKLMNAEIFASLKIIGATNCRSAIAEAAMCRIVNEIKLDDLVHFCNTGEYPQDEDGA